LQPVFDALLENATRLCEASYGAMWLCQEGKLRIVGLHGELPESYLERWRAETVSLDSDIPMTRAIKCRRPVQVNDLREEPAYLAEEPLPVAGVEIAGIRTLVIVPMFKDNEPVGSIAVYRKEVRPFTDKQIDLVQDFAAQAVIAIENTGLLNELRESLQQQTATADVLKVISRSTFDLQTALDTLVESAARLCEADKGVILRPTGKDANYYVAASYRETPEYTEYTKTLMLAPGRGSVTGRVLLEGKPIIRLPSFAEARRSSPGNLTRRSAATKMVVHVADAAAEPTFVEGDSVMVASVELGGLRTYLGVPMMRDNELIGVFSLARQEVRPFTEKQIALVTSFARQAVIAIDNTRLLNELRHRTADLSQRTADLTESLEQQTATAKVLDVISRSAFDLQAVFETVVESSVRLCGADRAFIFRFDGELLRVVATHNATPEFREWVAQHPIRPGRHTASARAALERRTIHIPDALADAEYTYGVGVRGVEPFRTLLAVPILKGDDLLGVLIVYHLEVRPFTDKQIALVETFADQAAIAIENVRLLEELRQRTDELGRSVGELTALGEVSQAVNSTLDLENVLSTIVAKAVQLSGTEAGAIYVFNEVQRELHLRATYGMDQELIDTLARQHIGLDEATVARALAQREPVQIADLKQQPSSALYEIILRAGFRSVLVAALLRGEEIVGLLVVRRRTPGTFPQNTVDLIKTFAAQSAVAIENARLFKNVETSLEDLRTAQDRLVQTQKLASLGQLTAGIAHEIKNPLNFVNNFSGVSAELIDELGETLDRMTGDDKTRREIAELTNTLRDNLDKIVQHGKRADSIVKNMLLHSREGSGEHRPVEINALVEESLNLAYHGARARSRASRSIWRGPSIQPLVRSMYSRRRSHGHF
jgi:two-component system, NtrC family, sensor kinase